MQKLVSIILPTYNGAGRISRAIESVLAQSYTEWELLVLDDGSPDDTEDLIKRMALKDKRIKYLKNEKNLGIQKTLNKGIDKANGEYIARIDDDDEWINKDKLKKQVEFMETHPEYVLVGTGFVACDDKGQEIFRYIPPSGDKEIRQEILSRNCFTHSSVFFRKDVALQSGGYSEKPEHKHIEDYVLWLKLGTLGKVCNLPIYGVRLILRPDSLSSENKITQFRESIKVIENFKKRYPNYLLAVVGLNVRMTAYRILNQKIFRRFYQRVYKFYKNL